LIRIRQQAVTPRFAPAIEAYVAGVVAGATGMSIGVLLGAGRAGERAVELRAVHLVLNVFGFIGLVDRRHPAVLRGDAGAQQDVAAGHLDGDARHVRRDSPPRLQSPRSATSASDLVSLLAHS
jgi:hypothetical protein